MAIGTQIASARKRRGLTQKQVADALDVSVQAVSQWETGKARIHQNRMKPLADLLGMILDDLVPEFISKGIEHEDQKVFSSSRPAFYDAVAKVRSNQFPVINITSMPFRIPPRPSHIDLGTKVLSTDRRPLQEFVGLEIMVNYKSIEIYRDELLIFDYGVRAVSGDIVIVATVTSGVVHASHHVSSDAPLRLARYNERHGGGVQFSMAYDPDDTALDDPSAVRVILGTMVERRIYRASQSLP